MVNIYKVEKYDWEDYTIEDLSEEFASDCELDNIISFDDILHDTIVFSA